jgi:hypothetical protein
MYYKNAIVSIRSQVDCYRLRCKWALQGHMTNIIVADSLYEWAQSSAQTERRAQTDTNCTQLLFKY